MVMDLESLEFDIVSVTDLSLWMLGLHLGSGQCLQRGQIEGALECVGLALSRTQFMCAWVMSIAAGLQSVKSFVTFLASCSSFYCSAKLLLLCRVDREGALLE